MQPATGRRTIAAAPYTMTRTLGAGQHIRVGP